MPFLPSNSLNNDNTNNNNNSNNNNNKYDDNDVDDFPLPSDLYFPDSSRMPPSSDIPIPNFMSGTRSFMETALSPFTTPSSLSTTNKEFNFDNGGKLEKTEDI